jgi:hypothetical protein
LVRIYTAYLNTCSLLCGFGSHIVLQVYYDIFKGMGTSSWETAAVAAHDE